MFAERAGHATAVTLGSLLAIALLTSMLWLLPTADVPGTGDGGERGFGSSDGRAGRATDDPLRFYCAMGMRPAIEPIVDDYEREFGVAVEVQYGGSGTLLSRLEIERSGDVYLAADPSYVEIAREKGLVNESLPLLRMRPVIAVPRGNPKSITGLDDLLRPDVSFALGNPEAASIGKQTKLVLEASGEWGRVAAACRVFKPTVNEILADVMVGAVDASVVWDPLVTQHSDDLEAVHVPVFDAAVQHVTVGVLNSTTNPPAALRFARYLQAPEKGGREFASRGYETIAGDHWAERPRLLFQVDGVAGPEITRRLAEFGRREGIDIDIADDARATDPEDEAIRAPFPDVVLTASAALPQRMEDRFRSSTALGEHTLAVERRTRFPYLSSRLVESFRTEFSRAGLLEAAGRQRGDDET